MSRKNLQEAVEEFNKERREDILYLEDKNRVFARGRIKPIPTKVNTCTICDNFYFPEREGWGYEDLKFCSDRCRDLVFNELFGPDWTLWDHLRRS
jgi:hypothetical protein